MLLHSQNICCSHKLHNTAERSKLLINLLNLCKYCIFEFSADDIQKEWPKDGVDILM